MKKKIAIILAILTLTSITACGQSNGNNSSSKTESSYSSSDNSKSEKSSHKESTSNTEDTTVVEETTKKPESSSTKKDVSTLDGIEAAVSEDVENTISGLEKEFDSLKSEIDTYDKYLQNTSEIEDFYNKIVKTNEDVCIRLYEYALEYANIVVNSNSDSYDKYDDLKGIYDCIYDDAGKDIYNGIYDGVLKDMYRLSTREFLTIPLMMTGIVNGQTLVLRNMIGTQMLVPIPMIFILTLLQIYMIFTQM